jgi:hypothetical protein
MSSTAEKLPQTSNNPPADKRQRNLAAGPPPCRPDRRSTRGIPARAGSNQHGAGPAGFVALPLVDRKSGASRREILDSRIRIRLRDIPTRQRIRAPPPYTRRGALAPETW